MKLRCLIVGVAAIGLGAAIRAKAGPLDLDLIPELRPVPVQRTPAPRTPAPPLPLELWRPGSPLMLRGESRRVQALSHAGNTALVVWGLAQSARGFGGGRDAKATTIGFGLVTAAQLLDDWAFWRSGSSAPKDPPLDIIFLPSK